ncbi:Ricin B lectin [Catenulispora acidiphila DSM 44928]|uniref:Ricin B lectin n=1 Tax=Catenulispora acidiphila (strain DSM 44928 / JCM 14897 / NBRC 102108 / NRRL B-24433 / ID139908) TaxID=479433 RepID=C7Q667_CATAD|nr:carbohydrate binding domain-containing protein [Catenulispora acidiphila]ACU72073.1 Ricin B lectin [Catenulispora acidiphila DSM 44928]
MREHRNSRIRRLRNAIVLVAAPALAITAAPIAAAGAAAAARSDQPAAAAPAAVQGPSAAAAAKPAPAAPDPQAALRKAMAVAHAKAEQTKKQVVVEAANTAHDTMYANPDGSFNLTQDTDAVRTDVTGSWGPIDTTLVRAADGSVHAKAAVLGITFSGGGTGALARLDDGGHRATLTWPAALPKPVLSGSSALYPNVYPDTDLRVTADAEGIREVLIVKTAAAAANPALSSIALGTTTSPDLKLGTNVNGAIVATDAAGTAVFGTGTALMWDSSTSTTTALARSAAPAQQSADGPTASSADGPGSAAQTATMPESLTGSTIKVQPVKDLLTGKNTKFPVYIDPTAYAPLQNWAEIHSGNPGTSYFDAEGGSQTEVMRAGWYGASGIVRSMFEYNVDTSLIPAGVDPSTMSAQFTVTSQYCSGNPHLMDVVAIDRFFPGVTWQTALHDANGNPLGANAYAGYTSPWNGQDDTVISGGNGVYPVDSHGATQCSGLGGIGYKLQFNDSNQVQNVYEHGGATVDVGLKFHDERDQTGLWAFFRHDWEDGSPEYDPQNPGSAQLSITFWESPRVVGTSITPTPTAGGPCDTTGNAHGYVRKSIGNTITVNTEIEDIDPSIPLQPLFFLNDMTNFANGTGSIIGPAVNSADKDHPGSDGWYHATQSATYSQQTAALHQDPSLMLNDGDTYTAGLGAIEDLSHPRSSNSEPGLNNSNDECFFTSALTSPDKPEISSTAFPIIGQPAVSVAGAGGSFTISGKTSGVPIDHYDWALNTSASMVGNANNGGGTVTGVGYTSGTSTLTLPVGRTTFGENTLWIRAVDVAGNYSSVSQYDFYLPGNPKATTTLGDVTGRGVPDLVLVTPDANGNAHLVVQPGNSDPAIPPTSLPAGLQQAAIEAAPASAAPDGHDWSNTLISHRGAARGVPVDDLYAYSLTTHALYYYLNSAVFGAAVPSDQFSRSHQVVVTRPTCDPAVDSRNKCASYDNADWSKVKQILAFGSVTGQKAGTFAGRTNLITVEDDGNGGTNLWLFQPAGGDQVTTPKLIGSSNLTGGYSALPGWNWANVDLIAPGTIPGDASGGTLPDLWARDRTTGTLWQFDNKTSNGVEDPTSLGNLNAAHAVGRVGTATTQGSYPTSSYLTLIGAGSPTVSTDGHGTLTEGGPGAYPALWGTGQNGKLTLLPGSAGGPITTSDGPATATLADGASRNAWTPVKQVTTLDGHDPTTSTGPIQIGWTQGTNNGGGPLCLDLPGGNAANGSPLQQYRCLNNANQTWTFTDDGSIRWTANQHKCLTIGSTWANNGGTANTSPLQISDCVTVTNPADPQLGAISSLQRFEVRQSPGITGWSQLYNPASGRCLDNGATTNSGTDPWLWDCGNGLQQAWLVPEAAGSTQRAEAELLYNISRTGTGGLGPQADCCGVSWSGGAQEMFNNTLPSAVLTLPWYVPYKGTYRVVPTMTSATDYGKVTLTVDAGAPNQQTLARTYDAYNPAVAVNPVDFGTIDLAAGGLHTFTFTLNGTNAASTGNRYNIGVDTLQLVPTTSTAPVASETVTPVSSVGQPITIDDSATNPGAASITAYAIDFGDGTSATSPTPNVATHAYSTPGTYPVKLTVTDDNGASASTTKQVIVLSSAPVANGDFERGDLSGWSASYNSAVTTDSPHSGTYAGQINAPAGGNGSVEQVVSGLKPNTSYTLTGWVRTDGGATILGTKEYDAADDDTGATTAATGWTQLSNQFTTGATNTSVDVYCYRPTAGASACDDFTLLATPAAGAVGNPDFETGNLAGWNESYNAGVTTTNPHGGTYAGQINAPTGGNGSIEQVVTGLTPNTSYTLTGWIRTDGGATILGTKDYDADPGDDTGATTTNTGWTQLTSQFTTGTNSTSVDIYCYRSTAGTSACDDFALTQTPATVANPDFETGTLDGWAASYNADITTTNPRAGTYAGQLNAATGDNASIEQVVTGLTPNTAYTLTGWVRTDGNTTYLGAKQYDTAGSVTDANTTATGWTQLTDQFTTDATGTSVDIYCYRDTAGTSACDDINLTKD